MTAKDEIKAMLSDLVDKDKFYDDISWQVNDKVSVQVWGWVDDPTVLNMTIRGVKPAQIVEMLGSIGVFDF